MMTEAERASTLRRVPLFSSLDLAQSQELAGLVTEQRISAGDWLFHAGDEAPSFFLIVSGRLAIVDERNGKTISEVGAGQWIGELGILADEVRAASVRAIRDSHLWAISQASFTDLLERHPDVQAKLLRVLARMVRESRPVETVSRSGIVGVLSTKRKGLAEQVAHALAKALKPYGTVETISIDSVSGTRGQAREDLSVSFGELLDHAEAANEWVLLIADPAFGEPWRSYVLDQSDRLVVIADSESPGRSVRKPRNQKSDLVVASGRPSLEWWSRLDPVSHHFIGDNPTPSSLAPLARRLAGKSLGLVMSGGGARGIAHFGVYTELVRAGVPLDRFGGTSAGAMAAGVFAMGLSPDDAFEAIHRYLANGKTLTDYTFPAQSLIKGNRLDRVGKEFYGDRLIERLPKSFFSVSADLITGREVVHRRGSLWDAVRASVSLPGILPPVRDGDRILVDGGLLNSAPADVMASDTDGEVICVDLRMAYVPKLKLSFLPVQPPAFVRRLVTGTDDALPSIQDTLMRSMDLAASARTLSDIPRLAAIIKPHVPSIGSHLDFSQSDPVFDAGRIAARAALEEHPELLD